MIGRNTFESDLAVTMRDPNGSVDGQTSSATIERRSPTTWSEVRLRRFEAMPSIHDFRTLSHISPTRKVLRVPLQAMTEGKIRAMPTIMAQGESSSSAGNGIKANTNGAGTIYELPWYSHLNPMHSCAPIHL